MTDEQALIATILAHPADDLPRLVFADFIEEGGDAARAEFIRVQCEICRLMMWRLPHNGGTSTGRDLAAERRASLKTLRKRERELWKSAKHAWFPQIEGENHLLRHTEECSGRIFGGSIVDAVECSFRRGFVESVRLPLAAFLGGSCERCHPGNGCPLCRQYGHLQQHHTCYECNYCSGTGRAEGIAKRLFESQPVLSIALSDREPGQYANTGEWYWVRWTEEVTYPMHTLPAEIFDRMAGESHTDQLGTVSKHYPSSDFAAAASSTVLVALARSLAALPPLRATPPAQAEATETRPAKALADVLHTPS